MKVYLRDHRLEASGWREALSECDLNAMCGGHQADPSKCDAGEPVIVFLHTDDANVRNSWQQDVRSSLIKALILISTGGRTRLPHDAPEGVYACHWTPAEFKREARPLKFAKQVRTGNLNEIVWNLLQPDPAEPILAAKLLVEAKVYEEKVLHGFQIESIPDELFTKAKAVAEADPTETAGLQSKIEAFEAVLYGVTQQS